VRCALTLAFASSPFVAASHAEDKPAEVKTIGPAVPLSAGQRSDIAAKDAAQAAARPEPAARFATWKPKPATATAPAGGARTPRAASTPNAAAPNAAAFVPPRDKMPPRAMKPPGVLSGLLDPFAIKPDEVVVIDGRLVRIPSGFPQAARRTP